MKRALVKRGQTCTFQSCTLFAARFLALTTSRPPSMPSFPTLLSITSTLSQVRLGNHEPQEGSSKAEMSRGKQSARRARSKCARLSPLDLKKPISITNPGTTPIISPFWQLTRTMLSECRRRGNSEPCCLSFLFSTDLQYF